MHTTENISLSRLREKFIRVLALLLIFFIYSVAFPRYNHLGNSMPLALDSVTASPTPTSTATPFSFKLTYTIGSDSTLVGEDEEVPYYDYLSFSCELLASQVAPQTPLTLGMASLANTANAHCAVPSRDSACFEMDFLGFDLMMPGNLLVPENPLGGFCIDQSSLGLQGVPDLPNSYVPIPNEPQAIGSWNKLFDKLTVGSSINGCPPGSLGILTDPFSTVSVDIQGVLDDVVYGPGPFACPDTGTFNVAAVLEFLPSFPNLSQFDLKQSCDAGCTGGLSSCKLNPNSCKTCEWCQEMYDNANFCKVSGAICSTDADCNPNMVDDLCIMKTIGNSGCQLTSIANIINYCAASQGLSFTTDPDQLNYFLEDNSVELTAVGGGPPVLLPGGGYIGDGGVNLDVITEYAALKGVSLSFIPVDSSFNAQTNTYSPNIQAIAQSVDRGMPVLLRVKNGGHAVLATKTIRDTDNNVIDFAINDPSHADSESSHLADDYSFSEIARYEAFQCGVPGSVASARSRPNVKSAASFDVGGVLAIGAGPGVQYMVTDTEGNETGFDPSTGAVLYNIPNATYGPEFYVDDEDSTAPSTPMFNMFRLAQSPTGTYIVTLIATADTNYEAVFRGFDNVGAQSGVQDTGFLSNGAAITYYVQYSSAPGSLIFVTEGSTPSATAMVTPTPTGTVGAAGTPTPTMTVTPTDSPTPTATATSTPIPTETSIQTLTPTPTLVLTPTPTGTIAQTATATMIPTETSTFTATPTLASTPTPTPFATPTATATPIQQKLSFSPDPLNFGTIAVDTSKTKSITIKNTGTKKHGLTVQIFSESTDDSTGVFFVDDQCAESLKPGGTCKVKVTFKPDSAGPVTGHHLMIIDDALGNPELLPLMGSGKAPRHK